MSFRKSIQQWITGSPQGVRDRLSEADRREQRHSTEEIVFARAVCNRAPRARYDDANDQPAE
jgi:hypothetical protein